MAYKAGSKVLIAYNPHDVNNRMVAGVIVRKHAERTCGVVLWDVRYINQVSGDTVILPFNRDCFMPQWEAKRLLKVLQHFLGKEG